MSVIIDRRLNDRNKSATNRERFMRRYRKQIRRAVTDMVVERSMKDMERGGKVRIDKKDIVEPALRHGQDGNREIVLPGNREFMPGDRLRRPPSQGEGDGDGDGGGGGDGEDGFLFTLSREEFMNIFFDDLELPRMVRTQVGDIQELKPMRAGYTTSGSPVNLAVLRTMREALGRRMATTASARRRLAEIEAAQSDEEDDQALKTDVEVATEADTLRARIARAPFLDEIDLRFRHRTMVPRPMSRAVMFCLMDVSGSMDEKKKDLAKRFFTLLYLFLSRKYEKVEVIFIRHTDNAEEVDEETFFHDPKTGGTIVTSALELMHEIIDERFAAGEWNLYGAQASDGDAFGADPERARGWLEGKLLPRLRHYAYIEVPGRHRGPASSLWSTYSRIECEHFSLASVTRPTQIYPVFRELFARPSMSASA